jgi:DNA-binding IclR family transcriptional regulator
MRASKPGEGTPVSTERKRGKGHVAAASADGTQTIRRAASILKAIAAATPQGGSLAEVSRSQNLARSTAHRILKCLVEEGLLEQPSGSTRYHVGPLVQELALASPGSASEVARWRPAIDNIARRTGVTTYLMRRSGLEAVCLHKADGSSLVRVIPVEVGQRRPLGVGAGATALLAALDAPTCERYIELISPQLQAYAHITRDTLVQAVQRTRQDGYAISQGKVLEQSFGLARVIPDRRYVPKLAISIAAFLSSVTQSDVKDWVRIIQEEIERTPTEDHAGTGN